MPRRSRRTAGLWSPLMIGHQGLRQPQSLTHSERESPDLLLYPVAEADEFQHPRDTPLSLTAIQHPAGHETTVKILLDSEVIEEDGIDQDPESASKRTLRQQGGAGEPDIPTRRDQGPGDAVENIEDRKSVV